MKPSERILLTSGNGTTEAIIVGILNYLDEQYKSKQEKWKPQKGERYWYMDEFCEMESYEWTGDGIDDKLFSNGNCYPTKEEAQKHVEGVRRAYKEIL
jgi:hypothetical protein